MASKRGERLCWKMTLEAVKTQIQPSNDKPIQQTSWRETRNNRASAFLPPTLKQLTGLFFVLLLLLLLLVCCFVWNDSNARARKRKSPPKPNHPNSHGASEARVGVCCGMHSICFVLFCVPCFVGGVCALQGWLGIFRTVLTIFCGIET